MGIVLPSNHSSKKRSPEDMIDLVCMALQFRDPYLVFILPVFAIFAIIFQHSEKMIVPLLGTRFNGLGWRIITKYFGCESIVLQV